MKVIDFPKTEEDETKDIHEMLDHAKSIIDEKGVTDAVLIMLDSEGNIGFSMSSDMITANGMVALAFKAL